MPCILIVGVEICCSPLAVIFGYITEFILGFYISRENSTKSIRITEEGTFEGDDTVKTLKTSCLKPTRNLLQTVLRCNIFCDFLIVRVSSFICCVGGGLIWGSEWPLLSYDVSVIQWMSCHIKSFDLTCNNILAHICICNVIDYDRVNNAVVCFLK